MLPFTYNNNGGGMRMNSGIQGHRGARGEQRNGHFGKLFPFVKGLRLRRKMKNKDVSRKLNSRPATLRLTFSSVGPLASDNGSLLPTRKLVSVKET